MPHCNSCKTKHDALDSCHAASNSSYKTKAQKCAAMKAKQSWTWVVKHRNNVGWLEPIAAEFKASMIFALIALGSSLIFNKVANGSVDPIVVLFGFFFVAIAHGYGLFVGAAMFGGLSADMNGTITMMRLIPFGGHQLPLMTGFLRLFGQFAGWMMAGLLWFAFFSGTDIGLAGPTINPTFNTFQGFFAEFLGSFVLSLVAFMHQDKSDHNMAVGQTLTGLMWIFACISGASFNAWRWLIPAIFGGFSNVTISSDFVYFIGPLAGSLVAWVFWVMVFDMSDGGGGGGGYGGSGGSGSGKNRGDCERGRDAVEMHQVDKDPLC